MKKYYNEDDDIVDDIVNEINQDLSGNSDDPEEISLSITLPLEDGTELECDVILMFEINENEQNYVALYPSSGEPDEIYLFRCSEYDGGENLDIEEIDDEDEYKLVCETFDEIMEQDEWNDLMDDDDD